MQPRPLAPPTAPHAAPCGGGDAPRRLRHRHRLLSPPRGQPCRLLHGEDVNPPPRGAEGGQGLQCQPRSPSTRPPPSPAPRRSAGADPSRPLHATPLLPALRGRRRLHVGGRSPPSPRRAGLPLSRARPAAVPIPTCREPPSPEQRLRHRRPARPGQGECRGRPCGQHGEVAGDKRPRCCGEQGLPTSGGCEGRPGHGKHSGTPGPGHGLHRHRQLRCLCRARAGTGLAKRVPHSHEGKNRNGRARTGSSDLGAAGVRLHPALRPPEAGGTLRCDDQKRLQRVPMSPGRQHWPGYEPLLCTNHKAREKAKPPPCFPDFRSLLRTLRLGGTPRTNVGPTLGLLIIGRGHQT